MLKACRILRSQEEFCPIPLRTLIEEPGIGQIDTSGSGECPVLAESQNSQLKVKVQLPLCKPRRRVGEWRQGTNHSQSRQWMEVSGSA
jgi:hypothetical protein